MIKQLSLLLVILSCSLANAAEWTLQSSTGSAHSFSTTLTIENGEEIRISADYETNPWEGSFYYEVRFGRWSGTTAWEVELTHHKIYLTNPPPEIDYFRITHGYNLFFVNRAWTAHTFILRAGGGGVLTYPVAQIRGIQTNGGYSLSGIVGQAGVEKRFYLGDAFFVSLEAKLTAAYTSVDLSAGNATAPNVALHGLFGVGVRFGGE